MTPPPSTAAVPPMVALAARSMTLSCLLVLVVVMATNKIDESYTSTKFSEFYAYRYMLSAGVIGIAYTLIQTALTVLYMITGNKIGGDGLCIVEFFGDKVVSYLLATGAAACFGLTIDLKRLNDSIEKALRVSSSGTRDTDKFFNKANAAATLLFVGFIFTALSSIISSLSLPKRS